MQKITSWSKLCIDWNDYGTVYVFWLLNYIYSLLNFLQPRTLIPSKHCIVLYVNCKKNIPTEYYRKNRPSPNKKRKKDTWSEVTIDKK